MTRPPGVLVEERYVAPAPAFRTGVPAFLGHARPGSSAPAGPSMLTRAEDLDRYAVDPDGFLRAAVQGFFGNGGRQCHVVGLAGTGPGALGAALDRAAELDDVDLVCAPDTATWAGQEGVHADLLAHCAELGDRFALLDGPPDGVAPYPDGLPHGQWGALYGPWLGVPPASGDVRFVPPSGHVAGLYGLCDERAGAHRAPASDAVAGAVDLSTVDGEPGPAVGRCLNVLRVRPGGGVATRGARTLDTAPDRRHVGARRTLITIGRWVRRFLSGLVFEPNDVRLRIGIVREITAYLDGLHAAGALRGATAQEAYSVRCDDTTTSPDDAVRGRLVTLVGVALQEPAEFVTVRVVHDASTATVRTDSTQGRGDDAGPA